MRVLCFGSYDPESARTRVLIKGLRQAGVEVIHCNVGPRRLPFAYASLARRFRPDVDVVLVCHPGHHFVPIARALTGRHGIPVVFDALVSQYDTFVLDRRTVGPHSFGALHYFGIDKLSCALCDVIVLDTDQHIEYFHETFGTPIRRFRRVPVGSDDAVFRPLPRPPADGKFRVVFQGTFIPLHGLQYIIRAASLLKGRPEVEFVIIGRGQTYPEIVGLAKTLDLRNVRFQNPVPYESLPPLLAQADVCLGIFGDTDKAKRVVPTKAFDALAMAKPLITGRSPAVRDAGFVNRANSVLVEMADPGAIAEAVSDLRSDGDLRQGIAADGYALFQRDFTPKVIGAGLKSILEEAVRRRGG